MRNMRLFRQKRAYDVFEEYAQMIKAEVEKAANDYVLNIDKSEWLAYFINRFEQTPLEVYPEQLALSLEGKGQRQLSQFGREYKVETTKIALSVPFKGTSFLFELCPSSYTLNSYDGRVSGVGSGVVTHIIELTEQSEQILNSEKQGFLNYLASNISSINKDAEAFNCKITYKFNVAYDARKQKALSENSFFEKLGININPDTKTIYQVLSPAKKRIPEPVLDTHAPKDYTPNPVLDDTFYKDVLEIIYNTYKSVEKKPSIYKSKGEEELRDYVLPMLETRYESSTVTGEAFNKGGKTDILVRYKDNTNLFVAECKYWRGESGFLETINQLFDRYLTWRDSKTALIFFVENKEFSKVLLSIRDAVKKHPYYLRENGGRGESSFSYIFHFPTDRGKYVYTEIMAFHFPE